MREIEIKQVEKGVFELSEISRAKLSKHECKEAKKNLIAEMQRILMQLQQMKANQDILVDAVNIAIAKVRKLNHALNLNPNDGLPIKEDPVKEVIKEQEEKIAG